MAWVPGLCSAVYDRDLDMAVKRAQARVLLDALIGMPAEKDIAWDLEHFGESDREMRM